MKIVFFGTPEFAVASLDRIIKDGYEVVGVVTMPDKVAGRGHKLIQSDVKKYALKHDLNIMQPEKLRDPEFIQQLRALDADLFVVIAFRMMPEIVWSMPPKGTFNLHGSLLPKYRGAAPINRAIMNGETITGVTTFFLQHSIDTGDIIDARSIEIREDDDAGIVHDKLMNLGAEMVSETLMKISKNTVTVRPQPEGEFIAAPKIFAEDMKIDFSWDVNKIYNHIRGLSPYPGARAVLKMDNNKEIDVKILHSAKPQTSDIDTISTVGTIKIEGKNMKVKCGDGWLCIMQIQPAGKRSMSAEEFLRGYHPIKFL